MPVSRKGLAPQTWQRQSSVIRSFEVTAAVSQTVVVGQMLGWSEGAFVRTGSVAAGDRIVQVGGAPIEAADPAFPIDVIRHRDRWMILDGIHRLARATVSGASEIDGRIVPASAVREL